MPFEHGDWTPIWVGGDPAASEPEDAEFYLRAVGHDVEADLGGGVTVYAVIAGTDGDGAVFGECAATANYGDGCEDIPVTDEMRERAEPLLQQAATEVAERLQRQARDNP